MYRFWNKKFHPTMVFPVNSKRACFPQFRTENLYHVLLTNTWWKSTHAHTHMKRVRIRVQTPRRQQYGWPSTRLAISGALPGFLIRLHQRSTQSNQNWMAHMPYFYIYGCIRIEHLQPRFSCALQNRPITRLFTSRDMAIRNKTRP